VQRRPDLIDKSPTGAGERDTTGRAIEQANAQFALELADSVARRSRGYAKFQRGRPERSSAGNRQYRFKFDETVSRHYPAIRNTACPFIPIITSNVYP